MKLGSPSVQLFISIQFQLLVMQNENDYECDMNRQLFLQLLVLKSKHTRESHTT